MDYNYKNINWKGSIYTVRILSCLAVIELVFLALFVFWPITAEDNSFFAGVDSSDEITYLEQPITTQSARTPPPPRPQIPVPVPNDEAIQPDLPPIDTISLEDISDGRAIQEPGSDDGTGRIVSNPSKPPSVIRIVEATMPEAAKRAHIKAEIMVDFLIDNNGDIEEAKITQIKLYDKNSDGYKIVDHINYGIKEATIDAALQWKFKPAQKNGKAVKAYSTQIFTYGF